MKTYRKQRYMMATTAYNYDEFRNLIFYPSGRIAYDWQYSGAVIL